MKTPAKLLVVAALAVTVVAAIALKNSHRPAAKPATAATASPATATVKLPKLLDLGADRCIPCKMMQPILDDLRKNYAEHFVTEFIDVWKNPDAGKQYGVELIPTQIFFDADGRELFRHVGFFGKEDILAKWKELGVDIHQK